MKSPAAVSTVDPGTSEAATTPTSDETVEPTATSDGSTPTSRANPSRPCDTTVS